MHEKALLSVVKEGLLRQQVVSQAGGILLGQNTPKHITGNCNLLVKELSLGMVAYSLQRALQEVIKSATYPEKVFGVHSFTTALNREHKVGQ